MHIRQPFVVVRLWPLDLEKGGSLPQARHITAATRRHAGRIPVYFIGPVTATHYKTYGGGLTGRGEHQNILHELEETFSPAFEARLGEAAFVAAMMGAYGTPVFVADAACIAALLRVNKVDRKVASEMELNVAHLIVPESSGLPLRVERIMKKDGTMQPVHR